MLSNARCWKQQLAALAIATSLLSGCAMGGSEPGVTTVYPLVVEYSRDFRARAADELDLLPKEPATPYRKARARRRGDSAADRLRRIVACGRAHAQKDGQKAAGFVKGVAPRVASAVLNDRVLRTQFDRPAIIEI